MATFGTEYITDFAAVRAAGVISGGGEDLSSPYHIAQGFDSRLRQAGHTQGFFWAERDVWEMDSRDESKGGIDHEVADSVDLFLISTHGNYDQGRLSLLYDIQRDDWFGFSTDWLFGNNCNLEWILIYGCHSISQSSFGDHFDRFQRLHLFCGSYGDMFDSWTVDEVGRDVAGHLLCGKPVSEAWQEGVSDWWVDNHPMVVSVERAEVVVDGVVDWNNTVLYSDHLWGHGRTHADIPRNQIAYLAATWSEG
jgi:hypothetical protein